MTPAAGGAAAHPPRLTLQASATVPVARGRSSKAAPEPTRSRPARGPKPRSIFSPDNSSDSEDKTATNKQAASSASSGSGSSSGSSTSGILFVLLLN